MKTPVTLIIPVAMLCLLSGCMKYQYVTINSDLKRSAIREHISGNDSIEIRYAFNDANGPVKIQIENKRTTPLYINWTKSSLIIDGRTFSYYKNEAQIDARSDGYEIRWTKNTSVNASHISGTISNADQVSFIPPRSAFKASLLTLKQDIYGLAEPLVREKINGASTVYVKKKTFDRDDSVLNFRSYLTLSAKDDFSSPVVFDDYFWVSEIKETMAAPSRYPGGMATNADTFYVQETSGLQ